MIPKDPFFLELFNTKMTYINEMNFYLKAVPALLKLQEDFLVPEEDLISQIIPKCFGARIGLGTAVDEDAAILLENLKPLGYSIKDKKIGLDFDHAKLVMEKLAYIHALPIALKRKRPDIFEETVGQAAKRFIKNDNKTEGNARFSEVIKQVFRELPIKSDIIDRAIKITENMSFSSHPNTLVEPFVTVVHGDLWVNNIMFAPDEKKGKSERIAFVDFQTILLNSPLCDVVLFLYTSVTPSVRKENFDKLIDIYIESFHKCLGQVDTDTSEFSKSAMLAELNRVAGNRLFRIFVQFRAIFADEEEVLSDVIGWQFRVDLGGQKFIDTIADIVMDFDKRGWLKIKEDST